MSRVSLLRRLSVVALLVAAGSMAAATRPVAVKATITQAVVAPLGPDEKSTSVTVALDNSGIGPKHVTASARVFAARGQLEKNQRPYVGVRVSVLPVIEDAGTEVYFDNKPGPVSGPLLKALDRVCALTGDLC
jgi:hypothetical protein